MENLKKEFLSIHIKESDYTSKIDWEGYMRFKYDTDIADALNSFKKAIFSYIRIRSKLAKKKGIKPEEITWIDIFQSMPNKIFEMHGLHPCLVEEDFQITVNCDSEVDMESW